MHIPKPREVLLCNFNDYVEFSPPEICKSRPVVIASYSNARPGLAIIVPLSTTPPEIFQPWHHKLSKASQWDNRTRWAKCDMLYAVALNRLSAWQLGGRDAKGKRRYLHNFFVSEEGFAAIQDGMLRALNIKARNDKAPQAGPLEAPG